jgi:Membrane fusion protein Use1
MVVQVENEHIITAGSPSEDRDELFWTELEFRRLGNMVAEMIQARRYVGDSEAAHSERVLLRKRIDAMRRKALRILCRAELYANSALTMWPGLDKNLTEPVSLAEEYVRTVSNYDAVLVEEEELVENSLQDDIDIGGVRAMSRAAVDTPTARPADDDRLGRDATSGQPDVTAKDVDSTGALADISYREALARETAEGSLQDHDELLRDGIRNRRPTDKGGSNPASVTHSGADEEVMARHQPVEDQLTSDLIDLVGRLKENVTEINSKLVNDNQVVDQTEDAIEKNLSGISKQRSNLATYTRSNSMSWWSIWALVVAIVIVFIVLVVLMRIPV